MVSNRRNKTHQIWSIDLADLCRFGSEKLIFFYSSAFSVLAYHICLNLPASFTKPGQSLLAEPCRAFEQIYARSLNANNLKSLNIGQTGRLTDLRKCGPVPPPGRRGAGERRRVVVMMVHRWRRRGGHRRAC